MALALPWSPDDRGGREIGDAGGAGRAGGGTADGRIVCDGRRDLGLPRGAAARRAERGDARVAPAAAGHALRCRRFVRRAEAFESSLRMAAAAVDRLDREINGRPAATRRRCASAALVESAWSGGGPARRSKAGLSLVGAAGEPQLSADAVELAQAVDNLISNGFDHGEGEVAVEVLRVDRAGSVGRAQPQARSRPGRSREASARLGARSPAAAATATACGSCSGWRLAHGGSFRLRRSRGGGRSAARAAAPG